MRMYFLCASPFSSLDRTSVLVTGGLDTLPERLQKQVGTRRGADVVYVGSAWQGLLQRSVLRDCVRGREQDRLD